MATRKRTARKTREKIPHLEKVRTGISGLDEITLGGLPKGRPTLVCGSAGCGKTLLSMEFIVRGATEFKEPGIFVTFEERVNELTENVASLGFDLQKLQKEKKIRIDYVHVQREEIQETGEYNLEGLFIRLDHAIKSIGAKRIVLDTIENLFSGLTNTLILRAELRRLFQWLKDRGVTAIITGERGETTLTRQGLEEYVSDCVILLDHRIVDQISTRRLRIIKYRGSVHGTNEYPFLIDEDGISVLPVTSLLLNKQVTSERISSGVPGIDAMLARGGFYKGSSILVSGTAGTGKTTIACSFVNNACQKGQRSLFFAFEESPAQIVRNMRSVGLDLQKHVDSGMLIFNSSRPTLYGLEMHLVAIHKAIRRAKPKVVVLDPISNFTNIGSMSDVKEMLVRLIDFLQTQGITVLFTSLSLPSFTDKMDDGISSLVDSWILIKDMELNGERNKGLYIIKSRGMGHSNQVREFMITNDGLKLVDVFLGPDGILVGSAREAQILDERTSAVLHTNAIGRKDRDLVRKKKALESRIEVLRDEFATTEEELNKVYNEEELKKKVRTENRERMTEMRKGNLNSRAKKNGRTAKK